MDASGLLSFAYSINFQIRQISATNNHFSCKKSLLFLRVKISEKRNITFFWLEISLLQASKYNICIYISLEPFTFFQSGWVNVVEIWEFDAASRIYSRPILRSTIEHCSLLWKLYIALFQCKTFEKEIE